MTSVFILVILIIDYENHKCYKIYIKMKNLMFLSVIALFVSCDTVNEENEVVITDSTEVNDTTETVVDTTEVNTFDPSGINDVQELLDTLEAIPSGTVIEEE